MVETAQVLIEKPKTENHDTATYQVFLLIKKNLSGILHYFVYLSMGNLGLRLVSPTK